MGEESKGRKVISSKQLRKGKEQQYIYVLAQRVCGHPRDKPMPDRGHRVGFRCINWHWLPT